jgi:hypothetical protein
MLYGKKVAPPSGATYSFGYGTSGSQQVGVANDHAGLWNGTAASWVDLNPQWAANGSGALATSGSQQVGYAFLAYSPHAVLWSGTAGSCVDLNPIGAYESYANSISDSQEVGWASSIGGNSHASLWSGTAASWVDLSTFLPSGMYSTSSAMSIDVSAGETWVAGYAHNISTNTDDAVLWHYVVPEPSSLLALLCGVVGSGGLMRRRRG